MQSDPTFTTRGDYDRWLAVQNCHYAAADLMGDEAFCKRLTEQMVRVAAAHQHLLEDRRDDR